MQRYPLTAGLAGLLALAGCVGAPAQPSAPAAPSAIAPEPPAAEAPATPPDEALPTTPEPVPAPVAEAPPVAYQPPASPEPLASPSVAPSPAPVRSHGGGGGGSGRTVVAAPTPPPLPAGPTLTVRVAPIAALTVDSERDGNPKKGLTDNDPGTRWVSTTGAGAWAQVRLGLSRPLYALKLQLPPGRRFDVLTSDDGNQWAPCLMGRTTASSKPETLAFPTGLSAKFVRVACADGQAPFELSELRLYTADGPEMQLPVAPPWERPVTQFTAANIQKAGVGYMQTGHTDTPLHMHAYLFIWYNGRPVEVPAHLGIQNGRTAYVHTHDATGTVHMEGPLNSRFTLGQFFTIWGVPMKGVKVYDHGVRIWNPDKLVLKDKMLLKVVFGQPPIGVPGIPLD